MKTLSQDMREKIILFMERFPPGVMVDRSDIKAHLGLEPFEYSRVFETALKSVRLQPIYESSSVTANGKVIGQLRPYVSGYKLISKSHA